MIPLELSSSRTVLRAKLATRTGAPEKHERSKEHVAVYQGETEGRKRREKGREGGRRKEDKDRKIEK